MRFDPPLVPATLVARRKRFLADIVFDDGTEDTAHCPNSGRMTACLVPGGRVYVSKAQNKKRKLKWTWELAEVDDTLVLVNTARPNAIVAEALAAHEVPELAGHGRLRREVRYDENSRCDIVLDEYPDGRPAAYVEVKNVTLALGQGMGAFPDAVSARGVKHLGALTRVVQSGQRAVLAYLVSRGDITRVRPADEIDPKYGEAVRTAVAAGVEVIALGTQITTQGVTVSGRVPLVYR